MQEIRRLVVAGVPYPQIWHQLGISRKSFYRYRDAVFEQDRDRMARRNTNNEISTQAAILEERFQIMYEELKEMANDKTIDPFARLDAQKLAAEVMVSIIKVVRESPIRALSDLREAYPGAFKKVAALPPLQQQQHDHSNDLKKCDKKPEKPKCYANMG